MDREGFNQGLLTFLGEACTPFHAAAVLEARLREHGFRRVSRVASLEPGGAGVVLRRGGSLVAVRPGREPLAQSGFRIVGAHTDSPCLMVKPRPEIGGTDYVQLGVEVYGGALLNPWFDRDLSLAGRVSFAGASGGVETALVDFRRPVAVIPSLAIHLDREANKNRSVNAQTQMAPILSLAGGGAADGAAAFDLRAALVEHLRDTGHAVEEVLDYELCFYDVQAPALIGLHNEFIASARLDNLLSCYAGLAALRDSDASQWAVLVCNDHEEVGSLSATGAQGPFLRDFLAGLVPPGVSFAEVMQRSMLISADNAHGVHPNYPDRHDPGHGPVLNGGPVIKVNASQRYASSSDGAGLFRLLARAEDVPVQSFVMRADMACGSTIGPISAGELGVPTLDVGAPTFAMHSVRELAGRDDGWYLGRVLRAFYNAPAPLFMEAAP